MPSRQFTFVVEHLDPELGPWSHLEYQAIARETKEAGCTFMLSSVPESLTQTGDLDDIDGVLIKSQSVETVFAEAKSRICLLDPAATHELAPSDAGDFDIYLFGGILGDDPPRDRTSELRKKGYTGRRLGPKQMTTDTAVRVTRMVVQAGTSLEEIPYTDYPELKLNKHESTAMPFRYVKGSDGKPVMPEGMIELIKLDADKGFGDLL